MEKEEYQTLFDGQERRKINSRFPGDPPEAPHLEDVVDAWRRQKAKSAPPAKKRKMAKNPTPPTTPEPDEDSVDGGSWATGGAR
jgi:hypothetical protein